MLTLSLLRHGKSSWSNARLKDIERPLSERGEKAVPRMGAFMARHGLAPDLILCSPAVVYEDALYLASPRSMLKRIHKVAAKVRHTMIVGHNPGLHALAQDLAGAGAPEDLEALAEKFSTAGLAVIVFGARSWTKVEPGGGRLELFMAPKRLP
jgi:phosphohistidine phosphatase